MDGFSDRLSVRRFVLSTAALVSMWLGVAPTAAFADCLPDVSGLIVTCQAASPNGYVAGTTFPGTPVNGVTIIVNSGATVGTGAAPSPLLSAGTTSVVNNQGSISDLATNTAISLGGGGTVTNAASATGGITGIIAFGSTTSLQVNTLNNFAAAGITGDITSSGNTQINNTSTITGNITLGAGNDTIINTGTLTGNIDMGAGINNFSASTAAQLPSGTLTAAANVLGHNTLTLTGTTAEVFNKVVTNFDFLVKNGTGSWSINTPITLTNEIDVNAGTLIAPNASNLGANKIVNNATVEFTNQANGTYSGNMSGTGQVLVDTGANVTTFSGTNTYTGGTTINAGTLRVINGNALDDGSNVTVGAAGTLDVGNTETIGGLLGSGAVTLSGGNLIVKTGNFTGVISGANGIQKIGTGTLTLGGANTFTGNAVVTNGTLILTGGAAIGDTTRVVVDSTATTAGTLQVNTAETIGSLVGTGNGGFVVLNANLTTGSDNTSTTYNGVISGAGGLNKSGTGTFILTGSNTYTGGTTISAGTLQLGNGGTTGSIVGNVTDNGNLAFDRSDNLTFSGVISGTGTVTKLGTNNLTLSGANSYSGGTTVSGGTLTLANNTAAGTGTIAMGAGTTLAAGTSGLVVANAITLTGADTIDSGTGTFTLNGVISGTGSFTKVNTGTLVLGGANTYTGPTTVSAGTLQGTTTSLQGNIIDNAAVVFSQPGAGTYGGNLSGTGTVTVQGGGTVNFTGANTYSGTTLVTGNTTLTTTGTGIGDTSAVTVNAGSTLTVTTETIGSLAGAGAVNFTALTTGGNGQSTAVSGVLTGGDLIKVGAGTMTLTTAASTLTQLDANGGVLDIGSTATVTTGAGNANVGGSGTLAIDGGLTTTLLQVASGGNADINATGTVNGPISNTGTTVVNGHENGTVTNNANGLLKGAGTITGTVTNNGTIAPGNSPGIIHVVGSYVQGAGGTYAAELTASAVPGTGYDQINVTGAPGTATLAGTLALAPAAGVYVSGATYDIIDAAGGISGSFATITGATVSPFLTFTNTGIVTVSGTEQVYRLTVTRTSYVAGMGAGATPNQIAVATGFQNLVAGAVGDAATLVTAVDNMTAAQAESFFDQASPEPYGAYATALQDQSELFTRQVGLHLHEGADKPQGSSFWGRGYFGSGSGSHQAYRFGSNGDIGGGAFGLDFDTGDFVLGAAGGWSEDQVKYGLGNSRGHSNSWQVGGYAGFTSGQVNADLQIAYANGSFGATKSIVVATVVRGSSASFNGNLFKVVGTVGYNTSLSDFTVRPFVGLDYDSGNTSAFTEAGAGAADLTVGKINMDKTNVMVGIDLIPSLSGLSPYGRLAYLYDVDNKARNISALFNGNPATAFTVSGVRPDQSEFDIDAGLTYAISASMSFFLGYQGTYRSDMNRNGVSAGVKINY